MKLSDVVIYLKFCGIQLIFVFSQYVEEPKGWYFCKYCAWNGNHTIQGTAWENISWPKFSRISSLFSVLLILHHYSGSLSCEYWEKSLFEIFLDRKSSYIAFQFCCARFSCVLWETICSNILHCILYICIQYLLCLPNWSCQGHQVLLESHCWSSLNVF